MEIFLNSPVLDRLGKPVGVVTNLIVSQSTRRETHFTFCYREDGTERLVSFQRIVASSLEGVKLDLSPEEIKTLPCFSPEEYKEIDLFEVIPDVHATKGRVLTLVPASERNISRRKFLKTAIGLLMGGIAFILAFPLFRYLTYPMYEGFKNVWNKIGSFSSLERQNVPQLLKFIKVSRQAYMTDSSEKSHWALKPSPDILEAIYADEENRIFREKNGNIIWENKKEAQIVVYSGKCPHLGCPYRWDESTKTFVCPCHNSIFKMTGEVISGPAPRRLDVLPIKVEGDDILVIDAEFRAGIKSKERIA